MPYKSEKIKLPPEYDRRRKLSKDDKQEIKSLYETGKYSLRELGRRFGVTHKTILLIVNAESKKKNDEYIKNHWKEFSLDKEAHNNAIDNTRKYKYELYKKGVI